MRAMGRHALDHSQRVEVAARKVEKRFVHPHVQTPFSEPAPNSNSLLASPRLTADNSSCGFGVNSKTLCDSDNRDFALGVEFTHLFNILRVEDCEIEVGRREAGTVYAVQFIFTIRNPLQIGRAVIGPVEIDVIYLRLIQRVWDVNFRHKPMKNLGFSLPIFRQTNKRIAVPSGIYLYEVPWLKVNLFMKSS